MRIKSPLLLSFIFLIIIILIVDIAYSDSNKITTWSQTEDLTSPWMYQEEICSYNGVVNVTLSTATNIICNCKPGFDNEKIKANIQTINGNEVQCSYIRKKRFITLFLAVFVPIGIDHFYLENYHAALIILISCCTACIGNCLRFAFPSNAAKESYFSDKINLVLVILIGVLVIWWILNISLIWSGHILDGYRYTTLNDIPMF